MDRLEALLTDLAADLPHGEGGVEDGVRVDVREVRLELPIEVWMDGGLRASAPRGRLGTGFDRPHGRLRARFAREAE